VFQRQRKKFFLTFGYDCARRESLFDPLDIAQKNKSVV